MIIRTDVLMLRKSWRYRPRANVRFDSKTDISTAQPVLTSTVATSGDES